MKLWNAIAMGAALLGAVSCAPVGTYGNNGAGQGATSQGGTPGSAVPVGSAGSGERATVADLRTLRERRAAGVGSSLSSPANGSSGSGIGNSGSNGTSASSGGTPSVDDGYSTTLPPLKIDYPYALPVPGRKGWVYAPETNRPVNVRGVVSGKLVYDETDPANRNADGTLKSYDEMPHKFRVP